MKKVLLNFGYLCIFILIVAIAYFVGYSVGMNSDAEDVVDNENSLFDFLLPFETEKRNITISEVEAKLSEINEIATYSGEYEVLKKVDYTRYFLDYVPIPGTTNEVQMECDGIVKVGYSIDEISTKIDESSKTIYITLPNPEVLDNYIKWNTIEVNEKNSIFNPIDFEQYEVLIDEIEEEGLEQVEEEGIYDSAEKNMKLIIENFLNDFPDYSVEFMN